ncbi:rhomboid family intramembrane serine protease [Rudanella paleaurantiibacter]|uniref:Rhomboid family intramembrane serine protease n=1 Tax=Rudanella paleaurantiibacter TaxID=2614655 RepID=A0A7J5U368_9BACT|nr:rhomboid family intramembrane serine protease [Rudanella paleaurantiibacter]KAB7732249.1 rhomboid family intramembrane serine protease [Rudanella paleaurantiibacter]
MSITLLIIVVTIAISVWAWNNHDLMNRWIMNPYQVARRGQYYRLLTSGFLHADWGHLIFNMLSFYFFGSYIEQLFAFMFGASSAIWLIGFYLVAIIVSDLPTFFKHRHNPGYNSLGASGGVSAIIFASILFRPLTPLYLMFIPIPVPGFIFGIFYLAYSFYESRRGYGNVNHDAHIYGALFGIVFMIATFPGVLPSFFEQIASWRLF